MTTIEQVLAKARGELGNYYPGNSKYGVWYGDKVGSSVYDSAAFCAMGLSWVFDGVGGLDIFPLHAYTPAGANWFKARGQWTTGTRGIHRGAIVFFDWPGQPNRISHVGIVESVNGDGSVNTIEFNTSGTAAGDQRNGRAVVRKRRKAYIVGYGSPAYSNAVSTGGGTTVKYNPNGRTSVWIKAIQTKLKALGYNLGPAGVDGDLGKYTYDATRAFQKAAGISVDGDPGPATMAALDRAIANKGKPALPKPPKPAGNEAVKAIQRAVGATDDGFWGNDTDKRTHAVRMSSSLKGRQFPFGVKYAQAVVGTGQDGDWGRKSIKAHDQAVIRVQQALKAHGFYKGAIDGQWGPGTDAAFVQAWRKHAINK
jgi:peptidoglycan hydrolase-like protein with peptidoglycan-binding domain